MATAVMAAVAMTAAAPIHQPECAAQPTLTPSVLSRMRKHMNAFVPGPKQLGGGARKPVPVSVLHEFEWACVDQETIVVYDPKYLADKPKAMRHSTGDTKVKTLPKLDFSDDAYYFRQATPFQAHERLKEIGHADEMEKTATPLRVIFGHPHRPQTDHSEITVRLASPTEVRTVQSFSRCTVPLVYQTLWIHNLNEWFTRGPVAFHRLQRELTPAVLPRNLSITLYSPLKIPVPNFNLVALQPYSDYAVTPFADFSARLPPSTPSTATAERTHLRCFRNLLVYRDLRETRGRAPATAAPILKTFAPRLQELSEREPPLWRQPRARNHMHVLIEQRANYGETRQFLELPALLAACNALPSSLYPSAGLSRAAEADLGRREHWSEGATVECIAHEFGKHPAGFVHDVWVMTQVDVFVTFHGAGQMNAIFLPEHSSMIEVRGLNASLSLADHWHPQISRGSGFQYFWWGLMISDPAFVGRSGLDNMGFYADADKGNWKNFMFRKRDQNAKLIWPHLALLLRRVAAVDKNATVFRNMYGEHFDYYGNSRAGREGVVYEVRPGSALPQPHTPIDIFRPDVPASKPSPKEPKKLPKMVELAAGKIKEGFTKANVVSAAAKGAATSKSASKPRG